MARRRFVPYLVPLALLFAAVAGLWPESEPERSEEPRAARRREPRAGSGSGARAAARAGAEEAAPSPPGSVSGLVLDDAGRPLADVLVRLLDGALAAQLAEQALGLDGGEPSAGPEGGADDAEPPLDLVAATDAAGRFSFAAIPGGEYLLVARSEALPPVEQVVALDRAAPDRELTLVLAAGRALAGRVVDEAGQPVAGATLLSLLPPDERVVARSGADGSFALPAMPADGCELLVEAEGFLPAELFVRPARPLHVELERPRTLTGLVLEDGRPAAGATVEIDQGMFSAVADDRGRFRFELLRPGLLTLDARLGLASAEPVELDLTRAPPEELTLELLAAGAAQLRVEDQAGAPIAGASVRLLDSAGEPASELATGSDGLVLVPEAAAGLLWVNVDAPGYAGTSLGIEITSGTTAAARAILLEARPLEVRVVHGGRPLLGADVSLRSLGSGRVRRTLRSAGGAADGLFLFEAVPVGRYTVVARHTELPGAETEAEVPGPGVVLELPEGLQLAGGVLDEDGRPVRGAIVTATARGGEGQEPGPPRGQRSAQSQSDGSFVVEGLPRGSYELVADAQGMIGGAPVRASAGSSGVELVLRHGKSLAGVVLDGGRPARDVFVTALSADEEAVASETTDAAGAFFLEGLEDEELTLYADLDGRESRRVRGRPGGGEVRLELSPGSSVRGRVVGPDGKPLRLFFVEGQAFHDPDGRFELTGLSPDTAALLFSAARLPDRLVEVRLRPGEGLQLGTVELPRGLRLSGVVRHPDGSPAAGASVHVRISSGEEQLPGVERAACDANGRFDLPALPPGSATVFALARGRAPSGWITVELREGAGEEVALTVGDPLPAGTGDESLPDLLVH